MPVISVVGGESFEGVGSNRGTTEFIVSLDTPSVQNVSVSFRTENSGIAIPGVDYFSNSGVLVFAPGETSKTITVTHEGDSEDEAAENYTLELFDPINGELEGNAIVLSATGVIQDDENVANNRALFVSDPKVLETDAGGQIARFELRLSEASGSSISLNYSTQDGTALAGSDYTAQSGVVTFAAGQTTQFIDVAIIADSQAEQTEAFSLVVTPNAQIFGGTQDTAGIATVMDDDGGALPIINISGGAAREGFGSNRGTIEFIVTLSEASINDVTVLLETRNDGSAEETLDYFGGTGSLTFSPGETQKIITITHEGDSRTEGDENYTLVLHSPENGLLAGGGPELTVAGTILDDEQGANVALFVSDPVLTETDGDAQQAIFTVQLSRPGQSDITLNYETRDGTAIGGSDYVAATGAVTFLAGQTLASVSVDIIGDQDAESTEQFSLVFEPTGLISNGVLDAAGRATILDDDTSASLPIISFLGGENREGFGSNRGTTDFTLILSEPSLNNVTVNFHTLMDGSAREVYDFFGGTGTVTFAPGETRKTITITHEGDSADEFDENYTLALTSPTNAVLSGEGPILTATGIVLDDEGGNDRSLFVSDPEIIETDSGTRLAVFKLELSVPSDTDISLPFTTVDGTALAGVDYQAVDGTVQFKAGQTLASISVPVFGDIDIEGTEVFSLVVTPNGYINNGTEDSSGIATIFDNDSISSLPIISVQGGGDREGFGSNRGSTDFLVTLSEPSLQTVEVGFRTLTNGIAQEGFDFFGGEGSLTFAPGETRKFITITHEGDNVDDADENYTLELHSPTNAVLTGDADTIRATAVIFDDEGGQNLALFVSDPQIRETDDGGQQAVFELTLSRPATNDISLNFQTADGSARAGEDYTSKSGVVTFLAGQTFASIAVDILADDSPERPENFSLVVTPNGFIQNGTEDSTGLATILDDDTSSVLPILSITGAENREGSGSNRGVADFIVSLSHPSDQTITVDVATQTDGSATAGIDFFSSSQTVTFAPGETQKTVSITHNGDNGDESDENYSVILSNPTGAVLSGEEPDLAATGIILDDESSANDLALFVSDPQIFEGDNGQKNAVFEVQLSTPSVTDITLSYTTADGTAVAGSDYQATSGTITFLAGQTVTAVHVPVFGDLDLEIAETFTLSITPNGFIQNGTEDSTGTATIRNDDVALDPPVNATGDGGNNELNGLGNDDVLSGLGGDDLLRGNGGDDTLDGGDGFDTAAFGGERKGYSITIGADNITVTDRRPNEDGTDVLDGIEQIAFGDQDWNLAQFSNVANLSEEAFRSFVEVYIAYFNRAPDAEGLFFWGTTFSNGLSLEQISEFFFIQPETQATYPDPSDTAFFVRSVYGNVLGREIDQAGFDFWTGVLSSGAVSEAQFLLEIIRGAKAPAAPGSDPAFIAQKAADVAYLTHKTDVGIYFSAILGMSDVDNARATFADFDGSAATTLAARDKADQFYVEALDADTGEFLLNLVGVVDTPDWNDLA